jgi:1-acyl-sn-glycerol-3-phosphate acyltransferase
LAVFSSLAALIIFVLSTLLNCAVYPFSRKLFFYLLRKEALLMLNVLKIRLEVIKDSFAPASRKNSNYLFISNHQSSIDILVLLALQPRTAGFIAKEELFRIPLLDLDMRMSGSLSIDRTHLKKAYTDIQKAVEKLKNRQSLHMFPEGTRNIIGGVMPLKKGFLRIAHEAGVPVVPIIIHGTAGIIAKHSLITRAVKGGTTVRIRLSAPLVIKSGNEDQKLAQIDALFQKSFRELEAMKDSSSAS